MFTTRLRTLLPGAVALALAAAPAAAQPWSGAGATGVDPYGHTWNLATAGGPLAWGIPGHNFGTAVWNGPTLTSFEITFEGGSPISSNIDPNDFDATRMWNVSTNSFFDVFISLDLHTATFSGGQLNTGDTFFVNVVFDGTDCATSFDAVYNAAAVPEPGTYALLATGLVVIAGVARRRRNG